MGESFLTMSLDDDLIPWPAAERLERGESPEPVWLQMAREQERREAEARARENAELLASETPEAEEARWSYRFRLRARDIPTVVYD